MAQQPHIDRKDLKGPDEFVEGAGRFARYVDENRNAVIGVAVACAAVFIGGISYTSYRSRAADSTAAAFLRAADAYQSDNLESAQAALTNVAERNRGPYDELARLYLADIDAKKGNYEAALAVYNELAAETDQELLRQIALIGTGHSLSMTGSHAEAGEAYAAAAEIDGPHRESALRGRLRAALDAGDNALAGATIEKLLAEYPSAPDAAELSAQLEGIGG